MCAINPKRQMHFTLSVYTSHRLTAQEFTDMVTGAVLEAEIQLNEDDGRLRWHVHSCTENLP